MRTTRRRFFTVPKQYTILNCIIRKPDDFGYITLNYRANKDTKFVLKFKGSTPHFQIGYISKTGNVYYRLWQYTTKKYYTIGSFSLECPLDTDNIFEFGNFYIKRLSDNKTIEKEKLSDDDISKYIETSPLYIFSKNINQFENVFYFLKIYEGNNLLYDLIPAKREKDGKIGVLDKVSDNFYCSADNSIFSVE